MDYSQLLCLLASIVTILLQFVPPRVSIEFTDCPYFGNMSSLLPEEWRVMSLGAVVKDVSIKVLSDCGQVEVSSLFSDHEKGNIPGTKWCGLTYVALRYDDLGTFERTDTCCRQHALCSNRLPPGEKTDRWTSCDCENRLRNCFVKVNSLVSNLAGFVHFTLMRPQCFSFGYPNYLCRRFVNGLSRIYCAEYDTNYYENPSWFEVSQDEWVFTDLSSGYNFLI